MRAARAAAAFVGGAGLLVAGTGSALIFAQSPDAWRLAAASFGAGIVPAVLAAIAAHRLVFRAVERRYAELSAWIDGTVIAMQRLSRGDEDTAAAAEIRHPDLKHGVVTLARQVRDDRHDRERHDVELERAINQLASLGASLLEQLAEQSRLRDDHRVHRRALDEAARLSADKVAQARTTAQFITTQAESAGDAVATMKDALERMGWTGRDVSQIAEDMRDIAAHASAVALTASIESARDGAPSPALAAIAEELRELARLAKDSAHSAREMIREAEGIRAEGAGASERLAARLEDFLSGIRLVNRLFEEIPAAQREYARLMEPMMRSETRQDELAASALATARESAAGLVRVMGGDVLPPVAVTGAEPRSVESAASPKSLANADFRGDHDLVDPGDYLPFDETGPRARSES